MFVSAERSVPVDYGTASSRLARLARGDGLREASEALYAGGFQYLMRVGPAGTAPGVSKLVRVRFAHPVFRDGTMSVGLRWEATGSAGRLFPALDADIRLHDEGRESTRVVLTGAYRPPFGGVGAEVDRLVMRAVADATIRRLLARVAAALDGAAAPEADLVLPWVLELGPEPQGLTQSGCYGWPPSSSV